MCEVIDEMNRKSSYKDLEKYQATSRAQRKRYYAQFEKYPPKPFNPFQDSLIIAHSIIFVNIAYAVLGIMGAL